MTLSVLSVASDAEVQGTIIDRHIDRRLSTEMMSRTVNEVDQISERDSRANFACIYMRLT